VLRQLIDNVASWTGLRAALPLGARHVTRTRTRDLRPGGGHTAAEPGRCAFPGQWHARMEGLFDMKESRQQP